MRERWGGHWGPVVFLAISALLPQRAGYLSATPLGSDIGLPPWLTQLRFSPDGRFIIAQDHSAITILTVKPFEVVFRLPAENSIFAQFTPDSKQIVFLTSFELFHQEQLSAKGDIAHVAWWRLADRIRARFVELPMPNCESVALAPDGNTFICADFAGDQRITDVGSAQTIFEKRHFGKAYDDFHTLGPFPVVPSGPLGAAHLVMSPDARFVLASPYKYGSTILFDLSERHVVRLTEGLRALRSTLDFAFVDSNHLMIRRWKGALKWSEVTTLVDVPSGKVVSTPELPILSSLFLMARTSDPNFVRLRPRGKSVYWAYNYTSKETITSNEFAFDVRGQYYVAEPNPGEVGLYERGRGLHATARLQ